MLLQFGDRGDNVKYLQYGLHILCCSPNGFDGEFGNGTLTAVKKFQSKYGLVSDGIVGDTTWNTLKNEIATLQAQLNKKGCNVGTVDGIAGPATYNAVISFQNKNGLTADGQVGTATWDILFNNVSGGVSYNRILKVTSPLMQGDDVKVVQNKLNSLGYNCGTADGYYGNDTKNAVIKFQSDIGLNADGEVGPATWNALFNNSSSGGNAYNRILKVTSPLMQGDDVKAVQNKLNSLEYNCGTADGYYGNDTKNAVVKFQSNRGLTTDGEVGPATWNALFSNSSSNGSEYNRILKVTSPLMQGNDIKAVQNKLNSLGYNCGTADGYYGKDTKNAVVKFQSDRGLTTDGEVGPATWNALFSNSSSNGNTGGNIGNIRKIYIDAGHGGNDSGAIGYDSDGILHYEKTIALNISLQQARLFRYLGYEVRLSRNNNNSNPTLSQRTAEANAWGADLFISNHVNAGGGSGIEVWHSIHGGVGKTCASAIVEKLCLNKNNEYFNQTNFKSRGIKSRAGTNGDDYYHVIRESNMPAIIIEHGFMDNKSDLDKLRAVNGMQHKLARLTVEAISGACAIRDITNTLNNLMKEFEKKHANNKPQNTIARLADFYFTVRNGSEGDLKNQGFDDDVYFYDPKLPNLSKSVYKNDCPGNISYGYLGMAYEFDLELIQRAAGAAQIMAGTWKPEFGTPDGDFPYGDDPHDQLDIILGSRIYNNK